MKHKFEIRKSRTCAGWELWTQKFSFYTFPSFADAVAFMRIVYFREQP